MVFCIAVKKSACKAFFYMLYYSHRQGKSKTAGAAVPARRPRKRGRKKCLTRKPERGKIKAKPRTEQANILEVNVPWIDVVHPLDLKEENVMLSIEFCKIKKDFQSVEYLECYLEDAREDRTFDRAFIGKKEVLSGKLSKYDLLALCRHIVRLGEKKVCWHLMRTSGSLDLLEEVKTPPKKRLKIVLKKENALRINAVLSTVEKHCAVRGVWSAENLFDFVEQVTSAYDIPKCAWDGVVIHWMPGASRHVAASYRGAFMGTYIRLEGRKDGTFVLVHCERTHVNGEDEVVLRATEKFKEAVLKNCTQYIIM